MILTVDVGNSEIALGGFENDTLSFVARIATDPRKTSDEYTAAIDSLLRIHRIDRRQVR